MTCEEARLKLQSLTDNELEEKEIPDAISHLESCYKCREEYVALLKLQKRMKGVSYPEPPREWFEDIQKKIPRKAGSIGGKILFFGSYIVLLVYAVFSFASDGGFPVLFRLCIGGIVLGLLVLLGITISDRVKESKTDKYKGVMK